ncbi:MAG: 4Fe-4S dicluster domain-containing protein [candidate division Zixibacteria bacterium]|nr:4Fe-4S dicluster domain-containing protein [candidate division Zixibacteria bacterium]
MDRQRALLIDITRCVGCGACSEACKTANKLPPETEKTLSATAYTVVQEKGDYFVRDLCRHCQQPTCVSVCPVGAFEKTADGPVTYDGDKCIGCRYCMTACPFSIPRYEWTSRAPLVRKCIMCSERVKEGKMTACSEACPAEATVFGWRDELIADAHRRISENPDGYYNLVYGENEVGGTNVLFLSPVNFADLGFPTNLGNAALPPLTWEVLEKIPNFVVASGVILGGLWWLINRRATVDELRHQTGESHPQHPGQSASTRTHQAGGESR